MGVRAVSQAFCCVCGTEHSGPASCPGELRATGVERPGWRVNVETPFGHEAIGVLLAPSHDVWRARILTYPNVLWAAPGGRGAIKFVGDTPAEAEARAIKFVEEHVRARRYLRPDGVAPVDPGSPGGPVPDSTRPVLAAGRRKSRCLPVRFGFEHAVRRAVTVNMSIEGMFVGVAAPDDSGSLLLVHLELDGHTVRLRGLVMWNRRRAGPQRPLGMGVRLSDPPRLYQAYVAALA